jgi:hypothetical protein
MRCSLDTIVAIYQRLCSYDMGINSSLVSMPIN